MRTPLYQEHVSLGAKMVDFHGWEMPLEYKGIIKEHLSVRNHVGIFDVSHMGDIKIYGPDAVDFVDYLFPSNIRDLKENHCIYTEFLNDDGLIIDDTILYRLGEQEFFFVPNASTTETVLQWVRSKSSRYNVNIENLSSDIACIAVQGKKSVDVAKDLGYTFPEPFTFTQLHSESKNPLTGKDDIIISGTGYTGEKGFEVICPSSKAVEEWRDILSVMEKYSGLPCGLGSRDSLRMEKGMLLSGTDFSLDRDPYECSISFTVTEKESFIGKKALEIRKKNDGEVLRGFITESKIIARKGSIVRKDGREIGEITSGTYSPILDRSISLGFIQKGASKVGDTVGIEVRGKEVVARVSKPKMVP